MVWCDELTGSGIETVVGACDLKSSGARVDDPVLCASPVAVVAAIAETGQHPINTMNSTKLTFERGYRWHICRPGRQDIWRYHHWDEYGFLHRTEEAEA